MNREALLELIKKKGSFLCVGLDTDINKIPRHLLKAEDPIFEFNKGIVDATLDLAAAYKPNLAFYESLGSAGMRSLEKTVEYVRSRTSDIFLIADAKRGDIGNTSAMYARTFFKTMDFDAVTLAPYMGEDTVTPFLAYPGKWSILLALTSNKSAADFQYLKSENNGNLLYESVLKISSAWGSADQIMYVVGATKAEALRDIRMIVPDHFLLVPGVGAQGGSLAEVVKYGMNDHCGLLVNSSRGILYASTEADWQDAARKNASSMQHEMSQYLSRL